MWVEINRTRWQRILRDPFALALGLSLLVHGAGFATWKIGDHLGWWKKGRVPNWVTALQRMGAADPEKIQSAMAAQNRRDNQLTFIEVDPASATDAPDNAEHYSSVSTKASNPDPAKNTSVKPKIDGKDDPFEKITDNRSFTKGSEETSKAFPLQPDFSAVQEPKNPGPRDTKAGSKKNEDEGETLMAKANPRSNNGATFGDPDEGLAAATQQRQRPRTVAEARARQGGIPGERTRQDGGVVLQGVGELNVKATGLGSYDALLIMAVREAWHQAMGSQVISGTGEVEIRFNLHSDGGISGLEVVRSSVDELLTYYCRRAIEKPKFNEWPPEMRREIGAVRREVTFTFRYLP